MTPDSSAASSASDSLCLCLENILFPADAQSIAAKAFQAANEALAVFDRDMNLVLANSTAHTIYGKENAAAGTKCWRLFQKCTDVCSKPENDCWLKRVLTTGKPFRTMIDQIAADGERILVAVSASPVFDDRQRIESVVVILRNVTEEIECLKNAGFWRSSEVTRAILDSLGEGVLLIDPQYRIVDSNKKFVAMTGAVREQVRGQFCYAASHNSSVPCWQKHAGRHDCPAKTAFESGEAASAVHEHYDATGHPHYVEVRALPLKDAHGKVFQVIETLTDITEQKKIEERLFQAEKMESIGNLTSGIAHDFNNILTPILGNAELVLISLRPGAPYHNELLDIQTAARRAAELVRHLLAFSRRQVLQKKQINLGMTLQDITPILRRLIPSDIILQNLINDQETLIAADPLHIEQIVMNLAVNARDAMPEGGRLVIETQKVEALNTVCHTCGEPMRGAHVRMMVSDTGTGMSAEILNRAFEPFFTTKAPGKGTGMGLATVLGIMHQHQGHINVYSEPGLGTTFKVYFPVADSNSQRETASTAVLPDALPRGSETVLVVDDDNAARLMIEKMLQHYGYQIISAANGAEGLALFGQFGGAIDLVVTDIVMPEISGKEMVKAMRARRPELPVLYMSGYSPNAIHHKGLMEKPGVVYLQKPPTLKEVLTGVRQALDG